MMGKITLKIRVLRSLIILGLGGAVGAHSLVFAEELPKQSVLPLALANKAALAAVDQCKKEGYRVSAAVVDGAGVVVALLRGDGAGAHTVDSSRGKAYTAASLREPTQKLARLIAQTPEIQALRDMNESILILGGGLPIKIGGEIVGGIGVGGAPGAILDENCARAGLESLGADPYKENN
ncbi:GlcG/HbpS family heme-binding protein [Nitrosococcus wardiae]|uniref:Heme-binding protein n=1 Tax=Nitrosococcus wardiae TaxID=1814290 RepID=A0A4P7C2A9_9GAMM|nr:heme-binding protein [Nitrosococcus wardiae]QBQ55644.1 heme-binding protein [Nitrosococcus wardiae]